MTGSRGYFGYSGSILWRRHIENVDPRPERMIFWWTQVAQRPTGWRGALMPAIARTR